LLFYVCFGRILKGVTDTLNRFVGRFCLAQPVAEPLDAPVAEPVSAPVAGPEAAPVAGPESVPVAKPAVPVAETVSAPAAQPVATPGTAPVATPIDPLSTPTNEPQIALDDRTDYTVPATTAINGGGVAAIILFTLFLAIVIGACSLDTYSASLRK
jgi:hypothetical protein